LEKRGARSVENAKASFSRRCPIVGIGASAGDLEALQVFLQAARAGCGLAFVLVQNLGPDHSSAFPDILAAASSLPIVPIEEGAAIEPDHFYVTPPGALLTFKDDVLHLANPSGSGHFRTAIDTFLVSLAQDRGEGAAGVILSGAGGDGAAGLRAIKESGGLTLAQQGAHYNGMADGALFAGLVDLVLPARAMPAKLADYFLHLDKAGREQGLGALHLGASDAIDKINALLRVRTGHDFRAYRNDVIVRRAQRRMRVLQIDDVDRFLERLRNDPHEVDLLFQDLLIGVTQFFRDPRIFEELEGDVVAHFFEGRGFDEPVRVWVVGCASGEEAYSIAMLLRECAAASHSAAEAQVFATDIDSHALAIARRGRYPCSIAKGVPARFLQRYFLHESDAYQVIGQLREMCLFARHDALRDPPFTKLDLISCRNLLTYLNPQIRERLVALFHYALRDGGRLLVGAADNLSQYSGLFSTVAQTSRIFERRPQATARLPVLPLTAGDAIDLARSRRPASDGALRELAEGLLLERYAPAHVIVNARGDILHASPRTGKYLELTAGPPSINIFALARRGLRYDLQVAIRKTFETGDVTVQNNIVVEVDGGKQRINVITQPIKQEHAALCMIVFEDLGTVQPVANMNSRVETDDATLRPLEFELRATKARLQTTTEALEASNEELKMSNDELSSINDELQSANEELEASKQELQSLNEELLAVNAELNKRVQELSCANSDVANLLGSTQIATIFLDKDLAIRRFTPTAKGIFYLVESDVGRPIGHVRSMLRLDDLEDLAENVMRTLAPTETQVETGDQAKRYIMRILPYRAADNAIAGVVINFIDVTRVTAAEAEVVRLTRDLRHRVESLERILDLVPAGILIFNNETLQHVQINRYGLRLLGERHDQKGPRDLTVPYKLAVGDRELPFWEQPLQKAAFTGEAIAPTEAVLTRQQGDCVQVMVSAEPLLDQRGAPRGAIAVIMDISKRKEAEARQSALLNELQHRVKNILATVAALAARMADGDGSLERFAVAFNDRVTAMGRVQELLSKHFWRNVGLNELASSVFTPYSQPRKEIIALSGPAVALEPYAATTLGMVLHELAANAAKHGSLSVPAGRVELSWQVAEQAEGNKLRFAWVERNGPRIGAFPRMGFGTHFIMQMVDFELEGKAQFAFEGEGLRVVIEFPLREAGLPNG
jgi:two-component system CheB/CheR fusion protein